MYPRDRDRKRQLENEGKRERTNYMKERKKERNVTS